MKRGVIGNIDVLAVNEKIVFDSELINAMNRKGILSWYIFRMNGLKKKKTSRPYLIYWKTKPTKTKSANAWKS